MDKKTTGILMVLFSAAGFATLAIFIKIAYAAGVNTVTMLALRFLLAAAVLWLILYLRGTLPHISKKLSVQLFLMGTLGYGTMSFFFALALKYLSASLAAMILYTYPALVSLLAFALGDEQVTLPKCSALAVCFAGLFLVLGVSFNGINPLGICLGLGAAVVYSAYIVIGNRVLRQVDSVAAATIVCTAAGMILLLGGALAGELQFAIALPGILAILGIAFFGTVIGILFFFAGMSRIGAANAAIISTTEPVITVLLSCILLNERITLLQAGGGLLILAGVVILQVWTGSSSAAASPALHSEE